MGRQAKERVPRVPEEPAEEEEHPEEPGQERESLKGTATIAESGVIKPRTVGQSRVNRVSGPTRKDEEEEIRMARVRMERKEEKERRVKERQGL